MDKAREQHNVLMDKGSEQLTAFGVSCYIIDAVIDFPDKIISYGQSVHVV